MPHRREPLRRKTVTETPAIAVSRSHLESAKPAPQQTLGLVRSEYLFASSPGWPGFDQQVETYRLLFRTFRCEVARVRVFDLSPEKRLWGSGHTSRGMAALALSPSALEVQCSALAASARAEAVELEVLNSYVDTPSQTTALRTLAESLDLSFGLMLENTRSIRSPDVFEHAPRPITVGMNDLLTELSGFTNEVPPEAEPSAVGLLASLLKSLPGTSAVRVCLGSQMTDWQEAVRRLGVAEIILSP